jgi:predicted RNase H-like HicB family nuclease
MVAVQTLRDMKTTRFNVVVQKEEVWYVAVCIDNSVASQGKTVEEALDNLKEALELYYEDEPLYTLPVPALLTTVEVAV